VWLKFTPIYLKAFQVSLKGFIFLSLFFEKTILAFVSHLDYYEKN